MKKKPNRAMLIGMLLALVSMICTVVFIVRDVAANNWISRPLPFVGLFGGLLLLYGVIRSWRDEPFIRMDEGRCPNCKYDLQGRFDDGCSECGWGRESEDDHST